MGKLTEFYLGHEADHEGRMISEIWDYSDEELEYHHDFIQWLFPLEVPSPVNPGAPALDDASRQEFLHNNDLRNRLIRSLEVLLGFYGLVRLGPGQIQRGTQFRERAPDWVRPGNHNHLRLTRIMHCLWLCGIKDDATSLLSCLQGIAHEMPWGVTSETLGYWEAAARE
jgi:hypothetical protein